MTVYLVRKKLAPKPYSPVTLLPSEDVHFISPRLALELKTHLSYSYLAIFIPCQIFD